MLDQAAGVPVVAGHAVSILATFDRRISCEAAREAIADSPGVVLMDDEVADEFPSPLDAAGRDDALVGRIRRVPGRDDALVLFSCVDNLRKDGRLFFGVDTPLGPVYLAAGFDERGDKQFYLFLGRSLRASGKRIADSG